MTLRNWFMLHYVCRFIQHDWRDSDDPAVVQCRRCHCNASRGMAYGAPVASTQNISMQNA